MKSKKFFIGLGYTFLLTTLSTVSLAHTYLGEMHVWRCPLDRADDYEENRLEAERVRFGMLIMSSVPWILGSVHPTATSVCCEYHPPIKDDCEKIPVPTSEGPAVFSVSIAEGSEYVPTPEQIVDIAKAFAKCGKFMAAYPF